MRWAFAALLAATAPAFANAPAERAPARPSHPEEVALVDEGAQGFVYRRFPGGERLYTFDRDGPGVSHCDGGCASAWPPVSAPADAAPVGRWTVVTRSDGTRQWALEGRPVYTRFHDSPERPVADGMGGVWHVLPYRPTRDPAAWTR